MSNRSEEAQALDLLSEQLSLLRFHGDLDLVVNLTASWGLSFEATPGTAFFYVVVEGSCFLEILGGPGESPHVLDLNIGDLVFLPQGACHHLKAETGSPVRPACQILTSKSGSERRTMVTLGAEGAKAKLIRGFFRFDSAFAPSFLSPLGQVFLVRALDSDRHRSIQSVLELLRSEQSSQEPGTDTATEALLKLLFIQLIRLAMAQPKKNGHPCEKRLIALMFAPSMQSVAHALHSEPEQPWSVAKLATLAGLSRTSFAVQFQSLTGIPPRGPS